MHALPLILGLVVALLLLAALPFLLVRLAWGLAKLAVFALVLGGVVAFLAFRLRGREARHA